MMLFHWISPLPSVFVPKVLEIHHARGPNQPSAGLCPCCGDRLDLASELSPARREKKPIHLICNHSRLSSSEGTCTIYIYIHIHIVISIIIFRSTNQETVLKDASVAHADLSIEISFHSCSILIPPRLKTFLEPVECIVSNHGDPIMGQNHGILIPN